ncbi:hypothetical protein SARC_06890 [Sphaeroforma arctica JP610]|uniref:N-acetylglucosaminylphosphatidylinositol deacetylase n=1 Tax=Sphaeroforma arctica JP610 TaxID=667725 RepID=A0A0L0FXS2_9EUKA|nr:hypothetical protein SARC_06890 [Sphaeroforma arctica JP610]KNC80763.1 hypothetical protein SARC_06890 [Sphaeroforma arctica JP610]|eukprot:XP_014154665.1 hypothetical protein SARC_06890 [Sphaeroforma arctica JP610]
MIQDSLTDPVTILLAYVLVLWYTALILWYILLQKQRAGYKNGNKAQSTENESDLEPPALIVIAHPDDECMFFAPTIISLRKQGRPVHILCLSTGNYNGLGAIRSRELEASCKILGVRQTDCEALDDKRFPDGPKKWNAQEVASVVAHYIKENGIRIVITFDSGGVSEHPNHVSCYDGVRHLADTGKLDTNIKAYSLQSISLWRKYSGCLDVIVSSTSGHSFLAVGSPSDVWTAQTAMNEHTSQLVWFRKLYIVFSRYMYFNTLDRINA